MLNKIQIIGRLGQKAELKHLGSGAAVASFSVATTNQWKGKDGEKQEKTTWFRVVMWGKFAEALSPYLDKGVLVYVGGRMEDRHYEGKDGVQKHSWELIADDLKLLGGGKVRHTGKQGHQEGEEEGYGGSPNETEMGW